MNMNKTFCLLLISFFNLCSVYGQDIEAITSSGRKVILSPTGTWQYDSSRSTSLYKGKGKTEINTIAKEKPKLNNNTLAKDTLYAFRKFFRSYKNCCVINVKDSTCSGVAEWADKVPTLKSIDEKKIGLVKFIENNFNKSACSKDYDFSIDVIFNVNCRGEIYDIKFMNKTDYLTDSQYYIDEFYKFTNAVYESMKMVEKINMTPPYYDDLEYNGKLNYKDFLIHFSTNKVRGLFVGCSEKSGR